MDSDFPKITLKEIVEACNTARDENHKYLIYFDKTGGNVATFFNYKGFLVDYFKDVVKVQKGNLTLEEACETFRKAIVNSMYHGHCLAINCDN